MCSFCERSSAKAGAQSSLKRFPSRYKRRIERFERRTRHKAWQPERNGARDEMRADLSVTVYADIVISQIQMVDIFVIFQNLRDINGAPRAQAVVSQI